MKIKRLHLKEYKRFFDLTIDLGDSPSRIIALVGPNGCGKSSVFDALLFLNDNFFGIGDHREPKDIMYHSLRGTPGYSYQNIKVDFDQGSYRDVYNRNL